MIVSEDDPLVGTRAITRGPALEPILKTENLWKVYRTGKVDVPALRGVDMEVLPGEFVSVMGPSGCGNPHFCT